MADRTPPQPRALATTGRHNARSITAAARRIDLSSREDVGAIPRNAAGWQKDAWSYYDLVPEVKFAARFLGNALSRLLLYPGIRLQDDEPPVTVRDAYQHNEATRTELTEAGVTVTEAMLPVPGLTLRMVEEAEAEMGRLRNRRTGVAGLLRAWGVCLTIPGDSYLVGTDTADGDEEWQVLSDRNVERKGADQVMIRLAPGAKQEQLAADATLIRVWRPHEAWPALADSNMRSVLDVCDELLIYSRQFRAVGKSRSSAGILCLPNELDFVNGAVVDSEGNPINPNDLTPFEASIVDSLVTPVEDDASASAVVPHLLRGPMEYLAGVRHISLDRQIDASAIQRVEHLIGRLAHGLDVPVEVLSGMADVNHWTAWQIQDSTYQAHVEPLAMLPAWALTAAYLRPMLAEGTSWTGSPLLDRLEVGIDPSMLVVRPNRAQDAKDAHGAQALSDDALRRYLGFSDADAPSDEELLRRYATVRGIGGQGLTREMMIEYLGAVIATPSEAAADEAAAEVPPGEQAPPPAPAEQDQPTPPAEQDAAAVAARPTNLHAGAAMGRLIAGAGTVGRAAMVAAAQGNVGARLAAIDQRLRDRLQVAASAELEEALRLANQRLRNRAKDNPELRAMVLGISAAAVGPTIAAAGQLTADEEDEVLAGAFAALADRWTAWVSQAQDDVEATLRNASAVEGEPLEQAMAEYRTDTDEDRRAGWAVLAAGLLSLARGRLRGVEADQDTEGEVDTTVTVQAGTVREALARAGGSVEPTRPPAQVAGRLQPGAAGGVATGPRSLGTLIRLGLATVGWEWRAGAPSHPFPPHQALQGTRFTSWDDPALVSAGWPGLGHYFPGDHRGCQCDAVPVVVEASARQGAVA